MVNSIKEIYLLIRLNRTAMTVEVEQIKFAPTIKIGGILSIVIALIAQIPILLRSITSPHPTTLDSIVLTIGLGTITFFIGLLLIIVVSVLSYNIVAPKVGGVEMSISE